MPSRHEGALAATRSTLAWMLVVQLLLPAVPAGATPTDFSTLAGSRGETPAAPTQGASVETDPFTGAATHAIPIAVPPGTGGLQPALVLRYSSQNRSDSWAGYGWTLGTSSVARSLKHGIPDYDDATDVFVLDGEELVEVGQETLGSLVRTSYATRRDRFLAIVHEVDGAAGSDSWTVRRKDGTASLYGTTAGSRLQRAPGEVFQWFLAEQRDPRGNGIAYAYTAGLDAGTLYPSEIRYGLRESGGVLQSIGADRVVEFVLEEDELGAPIERPDVSTDYAAGFLRELRHRLDHVDVRVGAGPSPALVRRYDLRYVESPDSFRTLLDAVALCGTDAETACATSPFVTSFAYHSNVTAGTTGWELAPWTWPAGAFGFVGPGASDTGIRLGDVDGDGLIDLVKALGTNLLDGSPVTLSADSGVYLNTGSGFGPARATSFDPFPSVPSTIPGNGMVPLSFTLDFPTEGLTWGNGTLLSDLTGDGRADTFGAIGFVPPGWDPETQTLEQSLQGPWCASTGDHFDCLMTFPDDYDLGELPALFTAKQAFFPGSFFAATLGHFGGNTQLADLTGDGLPELVVRGRDRVQSGFGSDSCLYGQTFSYVAYNLGALTFERAPFSSAPAPALDGCMAELALVSDEFAVCDLEAEPDCALETFHSESRFSGYQDFTTGLFYTALYQQDTHGTLPIDVNGDGLADVLSASELFDEGRTAKGVWLNDGSLGYVQADAWSLPDDAALQAVPSFNLGQGHDRGVRLADVNGDGRVDVLRTHPLETFPPPPGDDGLTVWLNDGDAGQSGDPGAWVESPAWAFPGYLQFTFSGGEDAGARLVDVDGDGMTDIVLSTDFSSSVRQVYLNRGSTPDLLVGVETPMGGSASLTYAPSTAFDNTRADGLPGLPQVVQVVASITSDDAWGSVASTSFDYAGGLFDATDREFRGFRRVGVTRDDGRETVTFYHQDTARAGLPEARVVLSTPASGPQRCWAETRFGYTPAGASPPFVSLLESRLELEYDGLNDWDSDELACEESSSRRTLTTLEYDGAGPITLGNPTATTEYGKVDAQLQDLVQDDTRTTELEYTPPNDSLHLVDRVSVRRLREGLPGAGGAVVRKTRLFYDGDQSGTAIPSLGNLSMQVEVLDDPQKPDPTTTFGYDDYGNRTSTTNPRENAGELFEGSVIPGTTIVDYDTTYHTFPVRIEDPLGHERVFEYDADAECTVAYPSGAGLVHVERGPNDLVQGPPTGWVRCYDVFGRQVLERAPADLAETTWSYDDTPGAVEVQELRRSTDAGDSVSRITRLDGFGREYETQHSGPQGQDVFQTTAYDAVGRVASRSAPHFSGDPPQATSFEYDVLDRLVKTTRPGTDRIEGISYADATNGKHGLVTVTDPNGNVRRRKLDPFGRVVRVEEEGPTGTLETHYAYDAADQLEEVTDSGGNKAVFSHDKLGRRTALSDPDTGMAAFDYDAGGNLLRHDHPLGATEWAYDPLDRPLERKLTEGATTTTEVTWEYDTGPVLVNGLGRLFRRTDSAGTYEARVYDLLGRVTSERRAVAGKNHDFSMSYDPLGQMTKRVYPNPVIVDWVRDAHGFVTAITRSQASTADVATGIEWDARGRLVAWTAGNGIETRSDYDPTTGRLAQHQVEGSTGTLERWIYTFDPGDRLEQIDDALDLLPDRSFLYDALDRLTRATGPYGDHAEGLPAQTLHYGYDGLGNLTCKGATAAPPGCTGGTTLVYPTPGPGVPLPHAPLSVGGETTQHDDAGNLTAAGSNFSAGYDVLGRLETASRGGASTSFFYDASGRLARIDDGAEDRRLLADDFEWNRSAGKGRIHIRLAGRTLATQQTDYTPGGGGRCGLGFELAFALPPLLWAFLVLRRRPRRGRAAVALGTAGALLVFVSVPFPLGGPVREAAAAGPNGVVYYHADHLGSSVLLSTPIGGVVAKLVYRPFGGVVPLQAGGSTAAPEFGFTGERFDAAVALYDYGARWYDPELGRFLQPDSLVPDLYDPQSLNPYGYVRNNPLTRIDPSGNLDFHFGGFSVSFTVSFGSSSGPPVGFTAGFRSGGGESSLFGAFSVAGLPVAGFETPLGGFAGQFQQSPNGPLGLGSSSLSSTASLAAGSASQSGVSTGSPGVQGGNGFVGALGNVGDAAAWGAKVLGTDAFAFLFGNTVGKLWTFGLDLWDLGSSIRNLNPLAFGKSLLSTAVNLAFPNYGFYNGRGYGLRQFPNGVPSPLNRLDQAGLNHDRAFRHGDWVRDAWSPSTPGLATGPLGLAYQTLGTPFFALGGAFQ